MEWTQLGDMHTQINSWPRYYYRYSTRAQLTMSTPSGYIFSKYIPEHRPLPTKPLIIVHLMRHAEVLSMFPAHYLTRLTHLRHNIKDVPRQITPFTTLISPPMVRAKAGSFPKNSTLKYPISIMFSHLPCSEPSVRHRLPFGNLK